ncbi:MAG: hypothetical protein DYG98_19535 [Haliscomenobacteraceae bacterium CHB4]|nr:hypothetical protein [Haliscomenobacteraceae bacterium CHB4]
MPNVKNPMSACLFLIAFNMKRFIFGYLHFSRRERLGTIVLTFICTAVFALPNLFQYLLPRRATDFASFQNEIEVFRDALRNAGTGGGTTAGALFPFDPNTASAGDFVRLGLSEKVALTICNYRDKGGRFRKPEDFRKIWSLPQKDYERLLPYIQFISTENEEFEARQVAEKFELFAFDPNTATESELLRLGLPQGTVRGVLNYRAKGGTFRKKEDFRKIYALKNEDYARLSPWIVVGSTAVLTESQQPYPGGRNDFAASKFAAKSPLDINRATAEEWQLLPGIGEKRAAQIIRFRESLGGFLTIEQLGEMYGLPDSVFQKIRPLCALTTAGIRRINLNAASEEDLDKHPYISGKQAKLIVAYREQHGSFSSVDDLAKIAAFQDKKWVDKVRPYLEVR